MSAKPVILIRDNNLFSYAEVPKVNPVLEWKLDVNRENGPLTVFTDSFLAEVETCTSPHKIAWVLEPPAISPHIYVYIGDNYRRFDRVFTHNEALCSLDRSRFVFCPFGATWIPEQARAIYPKSLMVSAIVSKKNVAPGHQLRHEAVAAYGGLMDVFGRGYREIPDKLTGLADYRYSVAIENSCVDSYFTEKLTDCFLTGTIPIYWGFNKVTEFFDPDGILRFETLDELGLILLSLSETDYERRLPAIGRNFELAKKYACLEETLWNCGLKEFYGE